MSTKSKFFRVAVEGATTDGRKIDRSWITQMAKNFNPQKYGARIWLEHIRGVVPESTFRAYGDVTALKAEEVEIDGEKRMALFAQINPTNDLVALTKARQKIYTSIEVSEKFSDTGEAYLVGLGITDSPASLGTDVLAFAAQNPTANPFTARKQNPDNLFSAAVETVIEFEEDKESTSFAQTIKDIVGKFTGMKTDSDKRFGEIVSGMEEIVEKIVEAHEKFADKTDLTELKKQLADLEGKFNELHATLDKTPDNRPSRPPATGQAGVLTDC